jgi:peptidase E
MTNTKIILHGGFAKSEHPLQKNDEFFSEMLKDTPHEVNMLLVYFAEREDMVQLRIDQDKEQLTKNNIELKKLNFRVASEDSFENDCEWANVIYLHGGRTVRLMETLKKYPRVKQIFSGKTISGDSAGANVICQFFYSKNSKVIGEGLGILPLKVVVHYEEGAPDPLSEIEPQLETLFLREYETKVFYL